MLLLPQDTQSNMGGVMYKSYINKSHLKIVETFTAVGVLPAYSLCKVQLPFLIFRSPPRFFPDYQPVSIHGHG